MINKLKNPPIWILCIIYLLSLFFIGLSLWMLVIEYTGWLQYVGYGLAATFLFYSVYSIVVKYKKIKSFFVGIIHKNKLTKKMAENYGFRTALFSTLTSLFNIIYAVFTVCMAILGRSIWYGALSAYYIALFAVRIYVLMQNRRTRPVEHSYRVYRNCGFLLFGLTLALSGAVIQMVVYNEGFRYSFIMVIGVAAFAFYKLGLAIYNIIKAKKYNSYYVQSLRNINLASAFVTLLSLQTALFAEFSNDAGQSRGLNMMSGTLVCLGIIGMGIYMIVTSNRKLRGGI